MKDVGPRVELLTLGLGPRALGCEAWVLGFGPRITVQGKKEKKPF